MEFTTDILSVFDKKWALLTVGDKDKFNTMTVSWGGLGTIWGKPVATVYPGVVRMGRVLTLQHGQGLGGKLLKFGIDEIRRRYSPKKIAIDSQCHAIGFYEKVGFKVCSDEFLEEGIMHVKMELR